MLINVRRQFDRRDAAQFEQETGEPRRMLEEHTSQAVGLGASVRYAFMPTADGLPRWDLTPIFPSLGSDEFARAFAGVTSGIADLAALFDRHDVRKRASSGSDASFVAAYEEVTAAFNALLERLRTVQSYIGCLVTTDARDDAAQTVESSLYGHAVRLDQLRTRYTAWVGSTDAEELLKVSAVAREHRYVLLRAHELARHQMSEAEESLASELAPASVIGWSRLHGNMTALLTADVTIDGEVQTLPMSSIRALANHADGSVRRSAYEAEIAAWETIATPIAAALNGVKGYQGVLRRRRLYSDDVEPTLLANGINARTLAAMQEACVESFPDFRRYLALKSRALGIEKLGWYDLGAPLGRSARHWSWPEAERFVQANFARYSERLRDFAARAFGERWVDAEPRVGKEGGAYCTGVRPGESRVMMNFDGSFGSVSTLAHELGHAYHNLNLGARTPLQRMTPSTLAETASIFCETLAFDAALVEAEADERLALLATTLDRDVQVVVDIHSRFLFEQSVFARRAERDLSVSEMKELMLDAQRRTYGPDVEPLHPLMWVVKGHYYGPTFYNYPYTFGLLFGIGLYANYRRDRDAFRAQYDEFLSSTGLDDAVTLGKRFGADVTDVAFWRSSLDVIREHIDEFEVLTKRA